MSIVSQPYVVVAAVPIIAVFIWLRQYFVKSSREIKRLQAASKLHINIINNQLYLQRVTHNS